MRKALPLLTAAVLSVASAIGVAVFLDAEIARKQDDMIYLNCDERNFCAAAMDDVLNRDGSIPVFGSSELYARDDVSFPSVLFQNGNSDFNMILNGAGYKQSLYHAVNIAALEGLMPGRKAVLILSPQWFSLEGISSSMYSSRFSERLYARFIKNQKLSWELRASISQRTRTLLAEDPQQLARVERYDRVYLQHSLNPVDYLGQAVYDAFMDKKAEFELLRLIRDQEISFTFDGKPVRAETIDFASLMEKAAQAGEEACTNNNFGVYDFYYDEYISDKLEDYRDSYQEGNGYSASPEYEDLTLFLRVCRETGVEPLIISVPVNGRWYDWLGFPKEERETYYQNIRDICAAYNVQLADFSDREYELYFLKDIMHMGWKGWVNLDEAIYKYYQGE